MKMARRRITSVLREYLPYKYTSSNAFRKQTREAKRKQQSIYSGQTFRRLGDDDEPAPIPLLEEDDLTLSVISSYTFDDDDYGDDGGKVDPSSLNQTYPEVISLSSISSHLFDKADDSKEDFNSTIQCYPAVIDNMSLSSISSHDFDDGDSDGKDSFSSLIQSHPEVIDDMSLSSIYAGEDDDDCKEDSVMQRYPKEIKVFRV
jgi:hypothetical protein